MPCAQVSLLLQFWVHCSGNDGVANCIAARVDTIEHGYFIDDNQLAQLRDLDLAWVPTFAPVQYQVDHAAALAASLCQASSSCWPSRWGWSPG